MRELEIRRGKYSFTIKQSGEAPDIFNDGSIICEERPGIVYAIAKAPRYATDEEWQAVATIGSDALKTYLGCNLLPSEILKQRDELVKILSAVAPRICNPDLWERIDKILNDNP